MGFYIPLDIWLAIFSAIVILIFGFADFFQVFVVGYVVLCSYVLVCAFKRD